MFAFDTQTNNKNHLGLNLSMLQCSCWLRNGMAFWEWEWGRRGDKRLNKTIKCQWTTVAGNVPSLWMSVLVFFLLSQQCGFSIKKKESTFKWTETLFSRKRNLQVFPSSTKNECGTVFSDNILLIWSVQFYV